MITAIYDVTLDPQVAMVLKALVVLWLTRYGLAYAKSVTDANALADRAKKRRLERDEMKHECLDVCESLDTEDAYYMSATEVAEKFRTNKLDQTTYLKGLIRRTRDVGGAVLNAVTEEMYDDSLAEMEQLTRRGRSNAGMVFKGVPVSIKECVAQEGRDSTCGAACKTYMPQSEDSVLVTLLRKMGMVPYVRTNVPQLLLLPETDNEVFGRTENPWDMSRTPGGSSGGEGALIGSGCSVAGLGSDIGGSIRIPAHFCGIVGFKPTPGRISRHGMVNPRKGGKGGSRPIIPTAGPMARSVLDCVEMMTGMCDADVHNVDKDLPPFKPFDKVACIKKRAHGKLRVGVMLTNDYFEPCLAVKRCVEEAAAALRKQGHEVVPFVAPTVQKEDFETFCSAMAADGNWYSFMEGLEGEDISPTYKKLKVYTGIPNWLRGPLGYVLRTFGEIRKADLMCRLMEGGMNVRTYWERCADLHDIATKWTAHMEKEELDGIIMPTVALPAPKHGMIGELMTAISYCTIVNVLHWPAGSVPITTVREDEAHYDPDRTGLPKDQRDSFAKLAHQTMEGSTGMPVGVQVVTPKWQDERCLFLMREIEEVVQFKERPNSRAWQARR